MSQSNRLSAKLCVSRPGAGKLAILHRENHRRNRSAGKCTWEPFLQDGAASAKSSKNLCQAILFNLRKLPFSVVLPATSPLVPTAPSTSLSPIHRSATTSSIRSSPISFTPGCGCPFAMDIPASSAVRHRPRAGGRYQRRPHNEDANDFYKSVSKLLDRMPRVLKDGGLLAFTFHHSEDSQWAIVLQSLFESGFFLEQAYPIASDEMKGEGGAVRVQRDRIRHYPRLPEASGTPTPVSWPKMRQWVKAELKRLRRLLESYKARELSDADIRIIFRGKALEFYSRHYGQVFTSENEPLSIRDALLGINQLLDEDTGQAGERPPSIVQPLAYQFLRLFGHHVAHPRRGGRRAFVARASSNGSWSSEAGSRKRTRWFSACRFRAVRQGPPTPPEGNEDRDRPGPLPDRRGYARQRGEPGRRADRDTWMVRRSVEAVLDWYAKTALEPESRRPPPWPAPVTHPLEQNRAKLRKSKASCSTICTRRINPCRTLRRNRNRRRKIVRRNQPS